ncbi:MAG TPA: hypothetical protein VN822_00775 [Candidatus Acidoferrales bacterium]|nr:hypothetical protein [Candidatus Acidoferrales bacterium]
MKAAALYLVTAVVTGVYVFYLAMETIWGAPRFALHYVSFSGSCLLVVASMAAPFRWRAGAIVALTGSAAVWCFFAPAIIYWTIMPFTFWAGMKDSFLFHDYVPALGPLVSPILLTASTTYAIYLLKYSQRS